MLANCAPGFRSDLAKIAAANGKTIDEVYALWRKYAAQCFDQSTLLSEFLKWYKADLPNLPEGLTRLG